MTLTNKDARIVLGMIARGDHQHDIAAWFGENGGRIAEVANGDYGPSVTAAPSDQLPPKGPISRKAHRLKSSAEAALAALKNGGPSAASDAIISLESGLAFYHADQT